MSKGGGKGRVSNNLVAASAAAVLTVYAAGYWRTRDEARRLEAQAQERRPVREQSPVAIAPIAPVIEAPAPVMPPAPPDPPAAAVEDSPAPEPKPAKKVAAASPAPPSPAPEPQVASTAPPAILSVPLEEPPKTWPAPPATPEALPAPPSGWRDGTYTGWGMSNHGDIEARVIIEGGRIVGSGIATCDTRYPCDVIETILFQPVWTQSPEVDRVSRATESADAYYYGLVEALQKAEAPAEPATAPK